MDIQVLNEVVKWVNKSLGLPVIYENIFLLSQFLTLLLVVLQVKVKKLVISCSYSRLGRLCLMNSLC